MRGYPTASRQAAARSTLSGDSIVYISLRDAQQLQFELSPPAARREAARGAQREQTNLVNAVVARPADRGGEGAGATIYFSR
jgi:hypothetical protein